MAKENLIFVGYYFPHEFLEENISKFYFVPFASNKLQKNILSQFLKSEKINIEILSFLPTTEYPKSKFLFVGRFKKMLLGKVPIKVIPYINIILIKHITKFFSLFFILFKILMKKKKGEDVKVMVYNLNSIVLFAINMLSALFNFKTFVIIADMPLAAVPNESKLIKPLRKLDYHLVLSLLRKCQGFVVLSKHLILDFFPNKSHVVLEGMLPKELYDIYSNTKQVSTPDNKEITFTYIGRLSSYQNVDGMVESFSKCTRQDIRLLICGKGELGESLSAIAEKDSRIEYLGFVPNDELLNVVNRTNYFINSKVDDGYFSKYSFPSKIIEYMASGKPTITFNLQGIPDEYYNYMIELDMKKENPLFSFFDTVKLQDPNHIEIGIKAQEFILTQKNTKMQSKRVLQYLFPSTIEKEELPVEKEAIS